MKQFDFDKIEEVDLDDFFENNVDDPQKKIEKIKCPCCDEIFEMKDEYKVK